jgi:predicted small secreted protein
MKKILVFVIILIPFLVSGCGVLDLLGVGGDEDEFPREQVN